eukprot:488122_1
MDRFWIDISTNHTNHHPQSIHLYHPTHHPKMRPIGIHIIRFSTSAKTSLMITYLSPSYTASSLASCPASTSSSGTSAVANGPSSPVLTATERAATSFVMVIRKSLVAVTWDALGLDIKPDLFLNIASSLSHTQIPFIYPQPHVQQLSIASAIVQQHNHTIHQHNP